MNVISNIISPFRVNNVDNNETKLHMIFLREEVTISSPVVGLLSFPFLKVHFSQWYLGG